MSIVAQFFEIYRTGYLQRAAEVLADLFAYPSHITVDMGGIMLVSNPSRETWLQQLERLFAMYDVIGVQHINIIGLEERQLSDHLWIATVHWEMRDANSVALYDFHNVYILGEVEDRLRITSAVSPDELPRYQACRRRLGV